MIKIAVRMPAVVRDAGEFLADVRALEAAGADTVWFEAATPEQWVVLGAVATVTHRIRIGLAGAADSLGGQAALAILGGGRVVTDHAPDERGTEMAMPPDRESWFAELRRHEERGLTGVVVPWDPRLIDLLRNPDADDRSDLLMSTG